MFFSFRETNTDVNKESLLVRRKINSRKRRFLHLFPELFFLSLFFLPFFVARSFCESESEERKKNHTLSTRFEFLFSFFVCVWIKKHPALSPRARRVFCAPLAEKKTKQDSMATVEETVEVAAAVVDGEAPAVGGEEETVIIGEQRKRRELMLFS